MYNAVISLLDALAALAFGVALAAALTRAAPLMDRLSRAFLAAALGIYLFAGLSNFLEHGGITEVLDPYEDYLEILFPLLFTYFLYSMVTHRELTLRRRAEEDLRTERERFRRIIEDMPDLVCRYRPDTTITFVNGAYAKYFNRSVDELVGKQFLALIPPDSHEYVRSTIASLSRDNPIVTMEHEVLLPGGERRWQLWRDRALFDAEGNITEIQSIGRDITDRKLMEEKLRALTITDDLTGLYNRRGFYAMAEQQVKLARRMRKEILLLSADLDNLKRINDTLGHQGGDAALVEAAEIIKSCFRRSDIIARVGGDEFVVLQIETTPIDPAALSARLQQKINERNETSSAGYLLSISFGIARFGAQDGRSIDEMLHEADRLMYEHKGMKRRSRDGRTPEQTPASATASITPHDGQQHGPGTGS